MSGSPNDMETVRTYVTPKRKKRFEDSNVTETHVKPEPVSNQWSFNPHADTKYPPPSTVAAAPSSTSFTEHRSLPVKKEKKPVVSNTLQTAFEVDSDDEKNAKDRVKLAAMTGNEEDLDAAIAMMQSVKINKGVVKLNKYTKTDPSGGLIIGNELGTMKLIIKDSAKKVPFSFPKFMMSSKCRNTRMVLFNGNVPVPHLESVSCIPTSAETSDSKTSRKKELRAQLAIERHRTSTDLTLWMASPELAEESSKTIRLANSLSFSFHTFCSLFPLVTPDKWIEIKNSKSASLHKYMFELQLNGVPQRFVSVDALLTGAVAVGNFEPLFGSTTNKQAGDVNRAQLMEFYKSIQDYITVCRNSIMDWEVRSSNAEYIHSFAQLKQLVSFVRENNVPMDLQKRITEMFTNLWNRPEVCSITLPPIARPSVSIPAPLPTPVPTTTRKPIPSINTFASTGLLLPSSSQPMKVSTSTSNP